MREGRGVNLGEERFNRRARYKRYHIEVKEAPPKVKLPPKYLVKRYNNCVNLQECVQACIYGVHVVGEDGEVMDPISEKCRGCFMCVLACPRGAISVELNPDFKRMGDSYFTPERIETIYFEAQTGRVPVSGTGYKGPFAGKGFDGMWFDFSEIVRPTRDGIHGREYISTSVDLGRKPPYLSFKGDTLLSEPPTIIEVPIPMLLDAPADVSGKENLLLAVAKAASELGTFAIVEAKDYFEELSPYSAHIIPRLELSNIDDHEPLIRASRIVEVNVTSPKETRLEDVVKKVRRMSPRALISLRLTYERGVERCAEALVKYGVDMIHVHVNDEDVARDPGLITRAINGVHAHLVDGGVRDEVTLLSSGGIAEAAHVPKSIILGADAVCVGLAYQIALGCKVCYGTKHSPECPLYIEKGDIEWAAQRIINLIAAWRDQLLEVLGGMGLREVRRLRGELGRAMFYEELEEKVFGGGDKWP